MYLVIIRSIILESVFTLLLYRCKHSYQFARNLTDPEYMLGICVVYVA